jgi:hypothetical protein
MLSKISPRVFLDKVVTKNWLTANTTFKVPTTGAGPCGYKLIPKMLESIPNGNWVIKPLKGSFSAGVVLFEKHEKGYRLLGSLEYLPLAKFTPPFLKIVVERSVTPKVKPERGFWFIEEWIRPHASLEVFTHNKLCPPMIRFSGRPQVHFIAICPMLEASTGLAGAKWQDRKYVWLDPTGTVRRTEDLNLNGVDDYSVMVTEKKSWTQAPFGYNVPLVPKLIEQINQEVASRIILWNDYSWSLDGTINENGDFVCIEINYRPGLQFRNFSWEK